METKLVAMHFKLYKDGEMEAAYTQALTLPSDNYVCLGYGPYPYRVGLQYTGDYGGGWLAFRAVIEAADGSRMTEMLPFLMYERPAQFPSVLVAPCFWTKERGFPDPPKMFVLTAQVPDKLIDRSNSND